MNYPSQVIIRPILGVLTVLILSLSGCSTTETKSSLPQSSASPSGGPANVEYSFTDGRRPQLGPTLVSNNGLDASEMAVFAMVEGTEAKLSTNRPSNGYEGASGQFHVYLNELNSSNSINPFTPYLAFTLIPEGNSTLLLTGFSFGARSLCDPFESGSPSSGPTRFVLRTSADDFSQNVFEGEFNGMRGSSNFWYNYGSDDLSVGADPGESLELRLYLLGATGEERAGVFRVDDVSIEASLQP